MSKQNLIFRWIASILWANRFLFVPWIVLLLFLLSSCAPDTYNKPAPTLNPPPPTMESIQNTPDRLNLPSTKMPERVPPTQVLTPVTGEVPLELIDQILSDLEKQTDMSADSFAVIQAQAVVWNDGSLGCPEPGQFYTQATVNGYQVIIEVNNKKYDYHASESGYFILCENLFQPLVPQETPDA